MRTRKLASSLVTALVVTASTLSPLLARADEPASTGTTRPLLGATAVAQSSTERGQVAGQTAPYAPAVPMAPMTPVADQGASEEKVWYGYQNLATDGLALVLVISAAGLEDRGEPLAWAAFATYALGSPMVHVMNDRGGAAVGSFALRLGLPLVLGGLGAATAPPCSDSQEICLNGVGELFLGAAIGTISAIVIDDFILARKAPVHRESTWAPTVAPASGGGMTFGVGGSF
jgi:hypothetical protein